MATITDLHGTVTTDGVGTLANLDNFDLDPFDLEDGKFLRLTLLIDDVSKIGNLSLFVGTSSLANNLKWRFDAETASSRIGKSGEVFTTSLTLAEINAVDGSITLSDRGAPSTVSGFTDVRLQVSDDATGPVAVTLLGTEIVAPAVTGGFLSITFDDGYRSTVELAYPRMASLGFAGTVYPSFDMVGVTDHATLDELRTLAGWEFGAHHSMPYTDITADEARAVLADTAEWLRTNFGRNVSTMNLSYPQGGYEDTTDGVSVETLVAGAGFATGRTILGEMGVPTHTTVNALPPAMPYRLHALSSISGQAPAASPAHPDNLIAVGGMLDKVAENGGWLILVFHRIITGTPDAVTDISEEHFNSIMSAIAARDLTVRTVRDMVNLARA